MKIKLHAPSILRSLSSLALVMTIVKFAMKGLLDQINQLMKTSEMLVVLLCSSDISSKSHCRCCVHCGKILQTKQQAQLNEYLMK
jgi:hypothetical protein